MAVRQQRMPAEPPSADAFLPYSNRDSIVHSPCFDVDCSGLLRPRLFETVIPTLGETRVLSSRDREPLPNVWSHNDLGGVAGSDMQYLGAGSAPQVMRDNQSHVMWAVAAPLGSASRFARCFTHRLFHRRRPGFFKS